jgi:predicted dehydrogenase
MTVPALRVGILGCANIARQFARDVRPSNKVRIEVVASRDAGKAAAFALEIGVARSHGSYEALLADPDIEAVYIPLPNKLHAEWAIKALQAGKHVLCEKPLALSRSEAQAMFDAARTNSMMLLEGYPYWFQPQTGAMVDLLRAGAIGQVRSVQTSFGFTVGSPQTNIRMRPELGGGALLDAGSYPLSLIRLVMGEAPVRVQGHASWADSGVDISMMATLFYADGRRAQMSCAMDGANHRHATIVGTQGAIETEYINHTGPGPQLAPGYLPSQMRLRRGIPNTIPFETIASPMGSGFRFGAEAFARVVAEKDFAAIERAAQASIDIAATLEAIAQSARNGLAVNLTSE